MSWWAYGVHLSGDALAALPAPPDATLDAPRASLSVIFNRAPVAATPASWAVTHGHTTRVGWGGEAEYVFTPGAVDVRTEAETPQHAMYGLLLSALPMALPVFGLEPMHGCVVARGGTVATLVGESGWGKSTLAGVLAARGWGVLSDDTCAVDDDGLVWPGPPLLRSRADEPGLGPYAGKAVVAAPRHPGPAPVTLDAVLLLDPGGDGPPRIAPLAPREALPELLHHVRSPDKLVALRADRQLRVVAALTRRPVLVLSYAHGRDTPEDVASVVESALAP